MAYYKKQQILEYIEINNEKIIESGLKPLTLKESAIEKVETKEDVVGFFWFELQKIEENSFTVKPKMEGKLFIKIGEDLYTDDRYAVDFYQATQEGKTVSQVIEERELEQEKAKKSITVPQNVDNIVNAFENKLKNNGA